MSTAAETRAEKYDADAMKELAAKGHTFKNPDGTDSYPIGDEEDLKNAIRAVGRGNADHDKIRKYIMGRAKDLGADVLVPSNWNSDGSLADEAKARQWDEEHRDSDLTYSDLDDMLQSAISAKFGAAYADCWVYVCDFSDSWAVYSLNGEKFQVDYSVDGNDVTLGDPTPVREQTTYVPMQTNSARSTRSSKKPRHRSGISPGLEVRHFAAGQLECRDDGSNTLQLVGTPIVYNTPYQVRDMWGTFNETMKPGVVTDLLANGCDTRFLFNHAGLPLGRTTSGTLQLEDTPTGLRCTVNLDARQQLATDLYVAAERGDINQMSVGMIVGEDSWDAPQENREITKLKALEDVSAVTYPASPTTNIAVAQRMLMEMPVESRERVRRMWAITRDLHDGRPVEPADIDVLSDGLRALAEADEVTAEEELRAEPTPQDKGIAAKIKNAHQAVTDAIHAQMGDPDNATDPVDGEVMGHLHDAAKSLLKATGTQAIDGASDIPPGTLGGPDGTLGNGQAGSQTGMQDGAGDQRKRLTTAELRRQFELEKIQRNRAARGKQPVSA